MDVDEAIRFVDDLLAQNGNRRLKDIERILFRGAWLGKAYKDIYPECKNYSSFGNFQRNVAPDLWKRLSDVLGEKVRKEDLHGPIDRAFKAAITPSVSEPPPAIDALPPANTLEPEEDWTVSNSKRQAWITPDVSGLCGRDRDLNELEQRIRIDGCRLITFFGMGGSGKTALAVELGQRVWDHFDLRIWRSLRVSPQKVLEHPPPLSALLADLTQFLSDQRETSSTWSSLLHYLVNSRCLIVLDGWESILQSGVHDGSYRSGYEGYGEFLEQVGRTTHQSCLIVTSREEPKESAALKEELRGVCSFLVRGLGELGGQELVSTKGKFWGSESDWRSLICLYDGNPLVLNTVAASIRDAFGGDISGFLQQFRQDSLLFASIRELLDEHFARLSEPERLVMACLTNRDEPVTFQEIVSTVARAISISQLEAMLRSLRRRALVEVSGGRHFLGRLVRQYAIDRRIGREGESKR
jgi:hypothetical protein